ncbi:isoquinoline 1-oxidoreductase beta subunit [Dongia mobilis]|uniref:Isoquinoline 1-oxidoreductase beta subunit n=1 Tax=Dongia mobilis TaxID=578943 RepID=A0A4R6WU87_9PROT|nr:xanthine dehydrogenase family protein molybdopterin-binding subunit [Dongia mobilis]TDQ83213.1 isoquinoline 1-oxidoreductase beta subunit [Dongia mobilis]
MKISNLGHQVSRFQPSRRQFLVGAAATGVGFKLAFPARKALATEGTDPDPFDAYIQIAPDNTVTILSAHMDMGQGCYHGIATLVAEELEADWGQLVVEGGAGNTKYYGNLAWGGVAQGTGGSSAMFSSFDRYRRAGALARTMLMNAAAESWGVPAVEITAAKGVLSHASGKSATYGEMAEAAAQQPLPAEVTLKSRDQWQVIGSETFRRLDSGMKSTGRQDFTIDVKLPGMLTAVIAHPPLFGAKVKSFDASAAKAVKGVVDVVQVSRGVAVVAENTWAAMKGREALTVDWDESGAEKRGSAELLAEYKAALEKPGLVAANRGDAAAGIAGASKVIEATYEFPYLAHAGLEPLDAVAAMNGDTLEIWGGHQMPDLYQAVTAQIAGVTPDKVKLHVMKTGGGFGRRAVTDADIMVEVVETAKAIGWKAPVKLLWTREDDMKGGRYRPLFVHKVKVGLDAAGNIAGWDHRMIGQAILVGTPFESFAVKDGIDGTSVEGVNDTKYAIPAFRAEVTNAQTGVPVLWWRSVGHTHTAYVMETMIDEVARVGGRDPVELRRDLLKDHPKHLAVLNLVAEKANWGAAMPEGTYRGIVLHESFGTVVGAVADIKLNDPANPAAGFKVTKVTCAVDCGTAINPDQIRAQIEGGVGFGLGSVLHEELTLTNGLVDQANYDSYLPLRIEEMPVVETHIVPSENPPTGVGEPGVPVIGPAVANALAAATGQTVRILPFSKGVGV